MSSNHTNWEALILTQDEPCIALFIALVRYLLLSAILPSLAGIYNKIPFVVIVGITAIQHDRVGAVAWRP